MSNGWDSDGSERLFCLNPPGGDNLIPSVFLGMPWQKPQPPTVDNPAITIGASDFSMEVWALRRFGNSPGDDEQFWTGILRNDPTLPVSSDFPDVHAAIRWTNNDDSVQAWFSKNPLPSGPDAPIIIGAMFPSRRGHWTYYCVNYDRDGNMECFIDTESKGTASIAAQAGAVASAKVHALTADHAFNFHNPVAFDLSNIAVFPVMVGPFAVHNRLLTATERDASFKSQTVQNLGSSVTYLHFNWHHIEGATGWDTDLDRMMTGHREGLQVPGGAPQGDVGTVFVRDESGNDRHWILPTAADYSTRDAGLFSDEDFTYPIAFGGDVTFR